MEVIAFVVLAIICVLAAIWIYIGPWAMWLVIAAVIFGIYKLCKSGEKAENEKYDSSEYVEKALRFIEFYELCSVNCGLFITPNYMGVHLSDENLGISIMLYLSPEDKDIKAFQKERVYKEIKNLFGGDKGLALYKELGLDVKLHKNDEDFPTIIMWHRVPGNRDRELQELEKYAKAIKRRYMNKYKKELELSTWVDW